MKHILVEEIDCGETTCASAPGKFCKFLGATHFGQTPCCMYFRDDKGDATRLDDDDGDWVKRSSACLDLFRLDESDIGKLRYKIYWEAFDKIADPMRASIDERISVLKETFSKYPLSDVAQSQLLDWYILQFGLYDGPKREETFFPVFNNEDRRKLGLPLQEEVRR